MEKTIFYSRRKAIFSSEGTTAKQDYLKQTAKEKKKDIVRQQFHADSPNQIWVSDVTYFKLEPSHFYVCVIIDLFSRKVISYKISKKNSTQLITSTFKIACETRQPGLGLIFHSDRGSQYTSHRFQQLLHEHGMIQSFSNSGRPHDNAVAESFFASFKKEELYRKNYSSEREFKQGVNSYIVFYNQQRPHRTLKNQTPEQVEIGFATRQPDMSRLLSKKRPYPIRTTDNSLFRLGRVVDLGGRYSINKILRAIVHHMAVYIQSHSNIVVTCQILHLFHI